MPLLDVADQESIVLRFKIGDRVVCQCGTWQPGTIVKMFYVQRNFPPGKCAPYQVKLDDGRLIYAPADADNVVREFAGSEFDVDDVFDDAEIPDEEKLAVTIVTGFLGAGKTTLVNYILNEQHGKKICVIENEFGAVNIDQALVAENISSAEELISMDNGCACCTVRGDLVKALIGLKDRRKDFDAVLLETTGLADPAPIIQTFESNPILMNHYRIDCVTTLVDVKFIKQHLDEVRPEGTVNEAVQQVAFADRVLLNKVDLISPEELRAVKDTVFAINSYAEQIVTERSRAPLDRIIDQSAYSIDRIDEMLGEYEEEVEEAGEAAMACDDETCTDDAHGHGHASAATEASRHDHDHGPAHAASADDAHEHGHAEAHEHGHGGSGSGDAAPAAAAPPPKKKKHDLSGVGSLGLTTSQPLDAEKFNRFMNALLQAKAKDLYRSKGVLQFTNEGDTKFVFQGVHEQIQFTSAKAKWTPDEPRISKIVFIGRDLDRDALEAGFRACYEAPADESAV